MEKSIRVRILGRDYPLRVQAEDETLTRAFARYVDAKMRAARENLADQTDLTFAVIAALSITEELYAVRDELNRLQHRMTTELEALDRQLARALDGARQETDDEG